MPAKVRPTDTVLIGQGGFRDLERRAVELLAGSAAGRVMVATANRTQVERLQSLLLADGGVGHGIRWFPSLRRLAETAGGLSVASGEVDAVSRAAMGLQALGEAGGGTALAGLRGSLPAAASLADFFEKMLLLGIEPESYEVALTVVGEEAGDLAPAVGRIFDAYLGLREGCFPRAPDRAMRRLPLAEPPDLLVLYGFYELNPLQRSLVTRLAHWPGRMEWLTPSRPGMDRWREVTRRTDDLLESLSLNRPQRLRGGEESVFGPVIRNMLTGGRTSAPRGMDLLVTRGELGTARAVVDRITDLMAGGAEPMDVAVVAREETGSLVARLCHHEGVPCAAGLSVPLLQTPAGRMVEALLDLEESDYHYSGLLSVASTGCLSQECRFDRAGLLALIEATGVRHGLSDWQAATRRHPKAAGGLEGFLSACHGYLSPRRRSPEYAVAGLLSLAERVMSPSSGKRLAAGLATMEHAPVDAELSAGQTADLIVRALGRSETTVRSGSRTGVRVLTPEAARGGLWKHVLVCDLEEDVFPGMPREDPRLPEPLREQLQLPSAPCAVLEQELLLMQAAEAASETLCLIRRGSDSQGRQVFASPFLDGLPEDTPERRSAGGPRHLLLAGGHPGQKRARKASRLNGAKPLLSGPFSAMVLEAELERISGDPFGPHDGNLGARPERLASMLSASLLESYARCPFACLAEKVWRLGPDPDCTVGSQPDPMVRGTVLHGALERILKEHGFSPRAEQVEQCVRRAASHAGLAAQLGSRAFEEAFVRRETPRLLALVNSMQPFGWTVEATEMSVTGTFAGRETRGRIDLVLAGPDGTVLLDFKTGRSKSGKTVKRRTRRGEMVQLPLYASLYSQQDGKPERVGYLYLEQEMGRQPIIPTEDLAAEAEEAEARAGLFADLMDRGYFPPLPLASSDPCRFCDLSDLCRLTPAVRLEWKTASDPDATRLKGEEDA